MDQQIQNLLHELLLIDTANSQWADFFHVAISVIMDFMRPYIISPSTDGKRSGLTFVRKALDQPVMCYTLFRMYPEVFKHFVSCLRNDYGLVRTREIRHNEQVAIFLFTIVHGASQRLVAAIFDLSCATVNDQIHRVLRCVTDMSSVIIQPHPNYKNGDGFHKPSNPRHWPFRDCIGAIDGTHVEYIPQQNNKEAYYNRKGHASQNVLAICDFNLCFTFASPGWEGSMHNSRVLREYMARYGDSFPHPGTKKYYLVDQGYAHITGYMGPYRGKDVRYHFQLFDNARSEYARKPKNPEKAFNYLHSSCRNVIERTFGVWKARFTIIQRMPSYPMKVQVDIVMATMAVHNFLRINQSNNNASSIACEQQHTSFDMDDDDATGNEEEQSTSRRSARDAWAQRRTSILDEILNEN